MSENSKRWSTLMAAGVMAVSAVGIYAGLQIGGSTLSATEQALSSSMALASASYFSLVMVAIKALIIAGASAIVVYYGVKHSKKAASDLYQNITGTRSA